MRNATRIGLAALMVGNASPSIAQDLTAKPASPATLAAQARVLSALPVETGQDATFAAQGFIATRDDPVIRDAKGKPVWNLDAYGWVQGKAPATVNPSLWRHVGILRQHGLFKVAEGVWQVRGFDVSNMTLIAGQTGWIVVDPLNRAEPATAALTLANAKLGARPVVAVIYTHSHADHFGGVKGVVPAADLKAGKVAIIAPEHFLEEAASENIMAGPAMGRRAAFQFGTALTPGPQGQMGSGIGMGLAGGQTTLAPPTDTVRKTGETRVIDGVTLEFQMVPESEAPAELNVMLPTQRTLLIGEIATCSQHNILTPRGALVRNALKWSGYLTEALRLYAGRSDVVASSHCWPHFGQGEVTRYLTLQRDNYKFLHDQSVRLMNRGLNATELAEAISPPPALAAEWAARGYYGTYNHNAKAVYQRYLGWYDANPANLNPHLPTERAKRTVAAMGGAAKVLAIARKAMAAGDYRWSSDILSQLVFADPTNKTARAVLADSFEQQGYQAESSLWRNMFLMAAHELRAAPSALEGTQSLDMISAIPSPALFDAIATRLNPAALGDARFAFDFVLTDRNERFAITVANGVMVSEAGVASAAPVATVQGPRAAFLGLFYARTPIETLIAAGLKVEGDRAALSRLVAAIETPDPRFNIVEP